ncbi:MAG: hypothetical protein ACM3SU_15570 [Acidobacteriota bacterium]
MKTGIALALAAFLAASAAVAQEKAPPPSQGSMADECMKHCKQMAEARQKAMDAHKAQMDKMDATFKEVRADLDAAKKARGDKKTAALEAAIEKLVSLHESMREHMGGMPGMGPGMMGHHGMMMGMGPCCPGMAGMMDCPMMKGEAPSKN